MAAFCFNLITYNLQTRSPDSIGNGIVDKVAEDAIDKAGIGGYHDLLGHRQACSDAFVLEGEGCVVEDAANNLYHIHLLVFLTIAEVIGIHLVEPCERTHVKQQFVHTHALGIAAL